MVEQLDVRRLEHAYRGRDSKAYHPRMLLALFFYGYATGIFSSRKLEKAASSVVPVMYICAGLHPDHHTIAKFRSRFLPELKTYFTEILLLAHKRGMWRWATIAVDGSKMKANASKHWALSYGHGVKIKEQLEAEVETLLQRAESEVKRMLLKAEEAIDVGTCHCWGEQ